MNELTDTTEQRGDKRYSGFVITAYTDDRPKFDHPFITYSISTRERCPTSGRLHWQCYIATRQITRSCAYKYFPGVAWGAFLGRKGSHAQARDYCMLGKCLDPPDTTGIPNTTLVTGTEPQPGERTDIKSAVVAILTTGYTDVPDHMLVKYHRGLSFVRNVRIKRQRKQRLAYWVYGPDLYGLEDWAWSFMPDEQRYVVAAGGKWFDYYDQEKVIIIHYESFMSSAEIKQLCGSLPYLLPTKGGHEYLNPDAVILFLYHRPWNDLLPDLIGYNFVLQMVGGPSITPPTS